MLKRLGLPIWILSFAMSAAAQTVTGTEFTSSPADTFTDPPNTMSNYGLTWADYSNGTLGPSAMLSGFGGINLYTGEQRRLTITASGNIGIGTPSPTATLELSTTAAGNPSVIKVVRTGGNVGGEGPALEFDDYIDNLPMGHIYTGLTFIGNNNSSGKLILGSHSGQSYNDELTLNGGSVGIGTTNPLKKLHIAGDVEIDGQLFFGSNSQGQSAAYAGCGADYAESVDVTGDRTKYEPGDVLVIDPKLPGNFLKSTEPYSTMAAGIYSTKPGYVGRLREANDPASAKEIPMAMLGRVPTKATAENGPIQVGDLLVTSSTMGYAMKGTDRSRLTGAVIGKALGSLDSGTGTIMVLVTLQ